MADVACFLAKEKGRNRVQVSRASDLEITQRHQDMDWADRIKDCLREDRIVLHSQRFTAMQAHHQDGFECCEVLTRLLDTEGNLVFPGAFIPAAERFGLIEELDRHIIRKAFAKLHSLSASQRAKTRYFINVSGITLGTPGFSAYIELMLTEYVDVRPCNVCFEVTETAAISDLAHTASNVRQLVGQGFSFALDDFGSGMSSFSYLEQLPVQYIKIDGEFVKGILTRPAGAAIVEAVVKVARAMDILTVAESVEFPELLPHLREIGIDYGQGFALHRPEPL
ncbi:EAL domain-containing protein [Allopusillimonas ginsengisoli]|uniref:EAL domain-containing protein n=1 Tax=Allopusillimonas ginsengisoli TaxID=453575 RepID=UPI0039C35289